MVAHPTCSSQLVFALKAAGLRARRRARDALRPLPEGTRVELDRIGLSPIAISTTPLWSAAVNGEARLEAGKVHNLRIAARALDGRVFHGGEVFGFWRHVGQPSRRAGFVLGREIREGCLVPAIGGGLCQLSNALYDAALDAGFEIVERHAHSVVVPGSLAEIGRDATVFWSYVDLRFTSPSPFAIEARLTEVDLVVRLFGSARPATRPLARVRSRPTGSCASCAQTRCPSHAPRLARARRAAFLVDRRMPELDAWVQRERRAGDVLSVPIDGARFGRERYAWSTEGFAHVRQVPIAALLRALSSRRLVDQGAARQRALLAHDERLARAMARALEPEETHLVVSQTLLPFLWREGVLGGRSFDVLMTRHALHALHARLDAAAALEPESATLADYRAPDALVRAEREALAAAARIVTPHSAIARELGERAVHVPWIIPHGSPTRGDRVVFLGPIVARAGVHTLRAAMRGLDRPLWVRGRELEPFDWRGVDVRRIDGDPLAGADVVVSPAIVEHEPRMLLSAIGRGVPVIATEACGLAGLAGVRTVAGDAQALRAAIVEATT